MTSLRSPRWLLATAMLMAITTVGLLSPQSHSSRDSGSAGIGVSASGWHGMEAVIQAQPRMEAARAHERGVRVTIILFVVAIVAAMVALAAALRSRARRVPGVSLPLILRRRSAPLRAPPLLSLG